MKATKKSIRIAQIEARIAKHEAIVTDGDVMLDDDGSPIRDIVTCGTCGKTWNDALISSWTPAPSGRCPYEYLHPEIAELKKLCAK